MKCPHCRVAIHEGWNVTNLIDRPEGMYAVGFMHCPDCERMILDFRRLIGNNVADRDLVWPKDVTRPVPEEVDEPFATDFREASATLRVSPKASAALSRRLLQHIIREKAGITKRNLVDEIKALIESGTLPSSLAENLDAVRVVGNFAAHPTKSTNTGEIVEVEPEEAAFLLDVVEDLFDLYFVLPEKARKQRAAIDAKLQEAGKPPLGT